MRSMCNGWMAVAGFGVVRREDCAQWKSERFGDLSIGRLRISVAATPIASRQKLPAVIGRRDVPLGAGSVLLLADNQWAFALAQNVHRGTPFHYPNNGTIFSISWPSETMTATIHSRH